MKTILAPIDFSAVTPRVVAEAAHLARLLDARLVLLNISRPDSLADDQFSFHRMMEELVEHPLKSTGLRDPDSRKGGFERVPVRGDSLQLIGDPVEVILQQAKAHSVDYIIKGSHGRSALHDILFGSVAAGVLKNAPCPIMIIPSRRKPRGKPVKLRVVKRPARRRTSL